MAPRTSRGWLVAVVVICLGIAVRIAVTYPVHKNHADADALLSPLRGLAILKGDLIVFISGARLGALESYGHALAFAVFGVSRASAAAIPIVAAVVCLAFFYGWTRELFDPKVAILSLLFLAVPSPAFLYWTYMPNGYPETLVLCVMALFLSALVTRRSLRLSRVLALGIVVGLGVWNSLQTLGCTLPAIAWVAAGRRDLRKSASFWLTLAAGVVLGAAPWLAYNLRYSFTSFKESWSPRPTQGLGAALLSVSDLIYRQVPELVGGLDPAIGREGSRGLLQALLRAPVLLAVAAALLWLLISGLRRPQSQRWRYLLILSLACMILGLYVFSAYGSIPGMTVRYILPFYIVVAVALGLFTARTAVYNRFGAGLIVAVVLAFNLAGYYWPGTPERRDWAQRLVQDREILRFLERTDIHWIAGDYWTVYPINFLSQTAIVGIPYQTVYDYHSYWRDLPGKSVKWALVSRDPSELGRWISQLKVNGAIHHITSGVAAFVPTATVYEVTRPIDAARYVQETIGGASFIPRGPAATRINGGPTAQGAAVGGPPKRRGTLN